MQYSELAFDTAQTKSPVETQKAEQGHHILCNTISKAKYSPCYHIHAATQGEYDIPDPSESTVAKIHWAWT